MLGLADRGAVRALFGLVLAGDAPAALAAVAEQYDLGQDPEMLVRELLDLVHAVTRAKLAPVADPSLSVEERAAFGDWADRLSFPALHRLWQLLLKGLAEVRDAPVPLQAAEMALLRLIHAQDLPDPADLIRQLTEGGEAAAAMPGPAARPVPAAAASLPASYTDLVTLFRDRTEPQLAHMLGDDLRLVEFAPPLLVLATGKRTRQDLLPGIAKCLTKWTGSDWTVRFVADGGAPTLREAELTSVAERFDAARADPVVGALIAAFPDAELTGVEPNPQPRSATGA